VEEGFEIDLGCLLGQRRGDVRDHAVEPCKNEKRVTLLDSTNRSPTRRRSTRKEDYFRNETSGSDSFFPLSNPGNITDTYIQWRP
jgi:hypothetical protein